MGIFDKRIAFKPYEYPEVIKYKEAINHSYWLVSEWNFLSDIQDFKTKLNDSQRNAIKNTLLAISQIEVSVKRFWTRLGERFPKAEFEFVGVTFGESEIRHGESYSKLLQLLDLDQSFDKIFDIPAIQGRINYLTKYLKNANSIDNKDYLLTLTLFSVFIENVSLFSQFAIIKSFNKHLNVLKDVDNVVQSTQLEEVVHFLFGAYLINKIKEENPEWFDKSFYDKINRASKKAFDAESNIIDWIFESGELDFLSKDSLKEFLKDRINESVIMIGGKKVFEVDKEKLKDLKWFNDELYARVNTDFFNKRPVSYSKSVQSITAEDLF